MKCVMPDMISGIDKYANLELNIPTEALMERAGQGVFSSAREMLGDGRRVFVLCGCGNNAGDGYCAAHLLAKDGYDVTALDVLGVPMRTPSSSLYYEKFKSVGKILPLADLDIDALRSLFDAADLIIDAIFGTGARGELSPALSQLADLTNKSKAKVLAVDVPLGVNASDGTLAENYIRADRTVTLSYPKIGLFSYPAKAACGEIENYPIGINTHETDKKFDIQDMIIDENTVKSAFPKRDKNSHKGTYGRLFAVCGSEKYKGAASLACHAALRTGAGLVYLVSDSAVCDVCCPTLPEVIYSPASLNDTEKILQSLKGATSILVGCGCGNSRELYTFVCKLLNSEGCPVILDADALNVLAEHGTDVLKASRRQVIVTPHPAEMARLCKATTENIQNNRMNVARDFSREYGVVTVLKGASTVITDGDRLCIDILGTPALAKGGSGDVLAGAISSLVSQGLDAFCAASCAVYLHSAAGQALSQEFSEYGVRPSDLPDAMARCLCDILKR